MATKVVMEALSPTMEEGKLVEWKKNEGDAVAVGDVLAEVETDKAVMELVARSAGTLIKRSVAAGATVPVASTVAWIGNAGEKVEDGAAPPAAANVVAPASTEQAGPSTPPPATAPLRTTTEPPAQEMSSRAARDLNAGGRVKASPLAKRMAADKGVDLSGVSGTGPEGRIIKRDVEQLRAAPAPAAARGARPSEGYTDVPLSQLRKTIAKRLAQSIGPIPTFYLTAEVDMERAHEMREALQAKDEGKFSFNDLIIRSAASALRLHPWVNAWWMDDHVRQWHDIHIGVAVAIEDGLIAPVVRYADQKTLREIAAEVKELAGRARQKKLMPDEYTGSTFSVSNLGMFGIDEFTAVINPPEASILAIGRIEPKPVAVNGAVEVRRRMRITMSCDHRVVDGATGAAFLKTLVGMLENPMALVW